MNILDLLQADGITAKKASSTNGGEYASPCPLCGGSDRFRSWPEQGDGGKWWCRRCEKGGDLIDYLRLVRKMSFPEACSFVGREPGRSTTSSPRPRKTEAKKKWKPKETAPPPELWQKKAGALIKWAEEELWGEAGAEARDWLTKERGLTEDTARASHLGWNPKNYYPNRALFGLPEELKDNGKPRKLWIPQGLVIPQVREDQVLRVKIRRAVKDNLPRYYVIPGSRADSMIVGAGNVIVVLESELDALLVHQEAGDLVGVLSLGSAQMRPDEAATKVLEQAELILVSLDDDDAGAQAAWNWWPKNFKQAQRWPPIDGKDPADMRKAGTNVRTWIEAGIDMYSESAPRSPESAPATSPGLSSEHTLEQATSERECEEPNERAPQGHAEEIIRASLRMPILRLVAGGSVLTPHCPDRGIEDGRENLSENTDLVPRWSKEMANLISWFEEAEPPSGPFLLDRARSVTDPERFYGSIEADIAQGPSGPRARTGALRKDLRTLYKIVSDSGEEESSGVRDVA